MSETPQPELPGELERLRSETVELRRRLQRDQESLSRLELRNLALLESESRLRAILDYTTAIIYVKDLQGRYVLINRRYEQFLGVERQAVIGKTVHDVVTKEVADAIRAHDQRVIATQSPHEWEEQIPLDDGMHTFLSQRFPLWNQAGMLYGVCGISTDITERSRRENERMEELQGLRTLVADAPVGVLIADAHTGHVLTVNHEAERISGVTHRPEYGWTEYEKAFVRRRLDGRVYELEELPLRRALRGEVVQGEELWFEFPDGRRVRVLTNATPVYGEDGRMAAVMATIQDVTNRAPAVARTPSQELRISQAGAVAAGTARPVAAYASERGLTRETNEDSVYCEPAESVRALAKGWLYAVADGMGGEAMGEVASRTAIGAVVEAYFQSDGGSTALAAAVSSANEAVRAAGRALPESRSMGTTLTVALVRDGQVTVAHVGDSRAYLIQSGAIRQITQDHSWVAELVRAGAVTPEQLRSFRYRNIITRALGREDVVQVDLTEEPLVPGGVLLLCSDGLSGVVEDAEIADVVAAQTPQQSVGSLMALAKTHGSEDDTSVVVVQRPAGAKGAGA